MYYLKNGDNYIVIRKNMPVFTHNKKELLSMVNFFEGNEKQDIENFIKMTQTSKKEMSLPYKLVLKEAQASEVTQNIHDELKNNLIEYQKIHALKLKIYRMLNNKLKTDETALVAFRKENEILYYKDEELFKWFKAETPYTKEVILAFNEATLVNVADTNQTLNLNGYAIYIAGYQNNGGFVSAHEHSYVEPSTISNARMFESISLAEAFIAKKRIENYSIVEINLNIFNVIQSKGKTIQGMEIIQSLIEKTHLEKTLLNKAENQKQEIEKLKAILYDNNLSHLLEENKVEVIKKRKI